MKVIVKKINLIENVIDSYGNNNIEIDIDVDHFPNIQDIINIIPNSLLLSYISHYEITNFINSKSDIIKDINLDIIVKEHDNFSMLVKLLQKVDHEIIFDLFPKTFIDSKFRDHIIDDLLKEE